MQLTFRAKLLTVVGAALVALLILIVGSSTLASRQLDTITDVESRLIPRFEMGPKLELEFEHLTRGMQDAVAAQDRSSLAAAQTARDNLFRLISSSNGAMQASEAATLRWAVQDYYESASDVSRRLIDGETGERIVEDMAQMQSRQTRATETLKRITRLDAREIAAAFDVVRSGSKQANAFRLASGVTALVLVLVLSLWVSRGVLGALASLSEGLGRFARGEFQRLIPVTSDRDLGKVAREANQMAANLDGLALQRKRSDWLKEGQSGLSDELRGALDVSIASERALWYLAKRVRACAGALYLQGDDGVLTLSSHYAQEGPSAVTVGSPTAQARSFQSGEGFVGLAAHGNDLLVVDDVPQGYLRVRSGLGEAAPTTLVFLPLVDVSRTIGVVELALFTRCPEEVREFLASVRQMIVVTLEAARSRESLRELLKQAQRQAERLAAQEEELRANNQELLRQQGDLKAANEELEAQRGALAEKNGELEKTRIGVQQKADELAKVSSYKSQFLANMSHELRTPLNSMLLLSQLLVENDGKNLTPKQVEHSKTIHAAGEDLLSLINQILDLAKIEAGREDVVKELVELEGIAAHARRVFDPLAADKKLSFVVEVAPGLPRAVTTDRQRLERILTNLLGNAVKFTDKGEVALRIQRPDPAVRFEREDLAHASVVAFSVTDTGIGIATEAHERVFAPFEQLESHTRRRYAGTGLGLAIARQSAALLGGELALESVPGRGSTFTCYLPEGVTTATNAAAKPVVAGNGKGTRIEDDRAALGDGDAHLLIIEDDPVLAEQLVEIVHARRFKVTVATTGQEGLRLARELRPRGIVLDVGLPDIDGWTVMERLSRDEATRAIPVHFVSATDAPERGLSLGALGFLMKPATHTELAGVVRSLTAPAHPSSRKVLVVEDSATQGDSIVALLRKEHVEATHVTSAEAALAALDQEAFGSMILDLGLPDMDGLGLLDVIANRTGPSPSPRVIVHTARSLTRPETRQLEAYAEAVILKDGRRSEERLLEEIRLFLRHIKETLPRGGTKAPPSLKTFEGSLSGAKILVADDDMRTLYATSALLRAKGAVVVVAENGREALDVLAANPDVRVVLMDVMMPEMDGYEAVRRIRQDARFTALPVIALTAKAMKGERERCTDAGASDYLAKPVNGDNLLVAVQTWIAGSGTVVTSDDTTEGIEIRLVLEAIHARYGYDFRGYNPESIGRRLRAALARSGLPDFGTFQHRILTDASFFGEVLNDVTVRVSSMFRDPAFYECFRREVVPILRTYPRIKIWHAGCASGEEVYAVAIVLFEEELYDRTVLYATDLSDAAVEQAREGVYSEEDAAAFEALYARSGGRERFSDYCSTAYGRVAVREMLRRNVVFFQHDLTSDYSLGEMQVILCRNVMIYFGMSLRERVVDMFARDLRHGGFLCVGASEGLPPSRAPLFTELPASERIYRRQEVA